MSRIVDIEEVLKKHTDYKYFSGYAEYDEGVETGVLHIVDELVNAVYENDVAPLWFLEEQMDEN